MIMLAVVIIIYGKGFIGSIGTYAIGTQVVFFTVIIIASYALGFGMPRNQKSVISLGISTRNNGAAMAPLFVVQGVDPNAIVMVTLGIPMMFLSSLIAARVFAARASANRFQTNPAWIAPRGAQLNIETTTQQTIRSKTSTIPI